MISLYIFFHIYIYIIIYMVIGVHVCVNAHLHVWDAGAHIHVCVRMHKSKVNIRSLSTLFPGSRSHSKTRISFSLARYIPPGISCFPLINNEITNRPLSSPGPYIDSVNFWSSYFHSKHFQHWHISSGLICAPYIMWLHDNSIILKDIKWELMNMNLSLKSLFCHFHIF